MRRAYTMKISEQAYCEHCDKDVSFNVVSESRTRTIRGIKITYTFKKCICKYCGQQVFPVSYGRENEIALYDVYKKSVGLLTSSDMKEIRKKLHLSQSQLAKLVGCGEKNIARYENGVIQIRSIDNAIRNLFKESNQTNEQVKLDVQLLELVNNSLKEKKLTSEDIYRLTSIDISNGVSNLTIADMMKLLKALGKTATIKFN